MATTGKINGSKLLVYVGSNLIAGSTSHSVSRNTATIDVTTKDSQGWTYILAGLRDWSIDGEGMSEFDATYGVNDLRSLWLNRTQVTVRFSTNVSGDEYLEGTAYLTSLNEDASMEEATTFSFTFTGNGPLNTPTYT